MIDEKLLRQQIRNAIGYEPPSQGFATRSQAISAHPRHAGSSLATPPRQATLLGLVAAFLAVAIVAALLLATHALHQSTVVPGQRSSSLGAGSDCRGRARQCAVFISSSTGWLAQGTTSGQVPADGPFTLYATRDSGRHWEAQLTWDCSAPVQMLFSLDGREGTIVAYWPGWQYAEPMSVGIAMRQRQAAGQCGPYIFHTDDGGAHWRRLAFPQSVVSVLTTGGVWENQPAIFFLNPREGWALDNLMSSSAVIYRTADGGASWTVVSVVVPRNELVPESGSENFSGGQLLFRDSLNGVFLPNLPCCNQTQPFLFVTHDGGRTWAFRGLASPGGGDLVNDLWRFANERYSDIANGVLILEANGFTDEIVYTTTDGDRWTAATSLFNSFGGQTLVIIDHIHWIAWAQSGELYRTDDSGKHWARISTDLTPVEYALSDLGQLNFRDVDHGWSYVCAVGGTVFGVRGCLSTTSDGGAHWTEMPSPPLS